MGATDRRYRDVIAGARARAMAEVQGARRLQAGPLRGRTLDVMASKALPQRW
jgi:hypothetical protein